MLSENKSITAFYEIYRPLQIKHNLKMTYKTSKKETNITISVFGTNNRIVSVCDCDMNNCFELARKDLIKYFSNKKVNKQSSISLSERLKTLGW